MRRVFNVKNQLIGTITDNKVFISPRNSIKHYFLKYGGYGISEDILLRLAENDVDKIIIRIEDKDEELLFSTTQYLLSDLVWTDNGDRQLFVDSRCAK